MKSLAWLFSMLTLPSAVGSTMSFFIAGKLLANYWGIIAGEPFPAGSPKSLSAGFFKACVEVSSFHRGGAVHPC